MSGTQKALLPEESATIVWLFVNGVLVMFMQTGFALLEAGSVRRSNVKSILVKNMVDVCIGAVFFWLFGFAFAYGGKGSFAGVKEYFGGECMEGKYLSESGCEESEFGYIELFFQLVFCATSSTIVSGAVAERGHFACYIAYSAAISGLIYPIVVHWMWGGGFLEKNGAHDFAGSSVVHMTGGMAALMGTIVIGPRDKRFKGTRFNVEVLPMEHSSSTHSTLGALILWIGWYGFNAGSTLGVIGHERQIELIALNTTLAPAMSGLATVCISLVVSLRSRGCQGMQVHLESLMNAILAGLVSITAGCATLSPPVAAFTGFAGGMFYCMSARLLLQLKIDDPLQAAPIHLVGGIWGMVAVGLFARKDYATLAGLGDHGVFAGGSGDLLLWNMIAVLTISVWVGATTFLLFTVMRMLGLARVTQNAERIGLDEAHYGGKETFEDIAGFVISKIEDQIELPVLSADGKIAYNTPTNTQYQTRRRGSASTSSELSARAIFPHSDMPMQNGPRYAKSEAVSVGVKLVEADED